MLILVNKCADKLVFFFVAPVSHSMHLKTKNCMNFSESCAMEKCECYNKIQGKYTNSNLGY